MVTSPRFSKLPVDTIGSIDSIAIVASSRSRTSDADCVLKRVSGARKETGGREKKDAGAPVIIVSCNRENAPGGCRSLDDLLRLGPRILFVQITFSILAHVRPQRETAKLFSGFHANQVAGNFPFPTGARCRERATFSRDRD